MPTLRSQYGPRLLVACLALLIGGIAAGAAAAAEREMPESTRRMAALLQKTTAETDPAVNIFMNTARARMLSEMANQQNRPVPPTLVRELAYELLNAGQIKESLAVFERLKGMLKASGVDERSKQWTEVLMGVAIAHLRQGETENCVLHHSTRSCIFPITGSGVHMEKAGSRAALGVLTGLWEQDASNLGARWLLNIAAMTLGEYPAGVPRRALLVPDLFESEYDIKPFPDVAGELKLDVNDRAGGSIVDDFDGDGYLDIMASSMGFESQLRYFRNKADGTFADRTAEALLAGEVGGLNIVQTDYNNDGMPDVLMLRGGWMGAGGRFPRSLLRNNGDGTFTDVTEQAGLMSFHPTQTAVWFDFDTDGWLDLYIGNESTDAEIAPCELYRNNGNGTFTECAQETGVGSVAFVKGVASADYDNDGRPDLFLSVHGAANQLFRNDGPVEAGAEGKGGCGWRFTEVAAAAGVTEPKFSFPTWFFDYDNDGWEDLYVSGYLMGDIGDIAADYLGLPHRGDSPRLYRNDHDGTFSDVTKATGLNRLLFAMGANYGDFDNDGWLDFYLGTGNPMLGTLLPNRALRNAEGRFFQDVTTSGGLGHLQKGHGVSFADLDNDGDQDIHHVVGGAFEVDIFRNALFRNPGHGNHWIALKLEGVTANRPGVGARIKVVVRTSDGERAIYKTVRSGGSFGASPLRQEIGLGAALKIERIEIDWPGSGPAQILTGVEMDRVYRVREGDQNLAVIKLNQLKLGS